MLGLLSKEAKLNKIHGIQVARKTLKISHLLFADDSLWFARANIVEAERILQVLHSYQRASGQVVNLDKSEASFSRNVCEEEKEMICNQMNVKTVMSHTRYLGLPVVFGRSKKEIFSFVIDRVWKKRKGWKEKSFEGWERGVDQSCGTSHSELYYELLQITGRLV